MAKKQGVALFDFDDTLVIGNSQRELIRLLVFEQKSFIAVARCVFRAFKIVVKARFRLREAIKISFLSEFIEGRKASELSRLCPSIAARLRVNASALNALHGEVASGNIIWVVTASPAFIVEGVLEQLDLKVGAAEIVVLGSELEISNIELTGKFKFECIRENKVVAIQDKVRASGLDIKVNAAYGNLPDDLQMLCLADRAYAVRKDKVERTRLLH